MHRLVAIALLALLAGTAAAQNGGNGKPNTTFIAPLGYCQFTVSNSATTLAAATPTAGTTCVPPSRTAMAVMYIETAAIRYRDDPAGTAPTATVGQPVPVGPFRYNSDLSKLSIIAQSGTATIDVSFYDGTPL